MVMLTEDGVRWMVANPKLHARWKHRRGVIESNSRNGWHRVRWDGNKSSEARVNWGSARRLEAVATTRARGFGPALTPPA